MKQVKKWILGGLLVLMLTATASASQKLTKEELESIRGAFYEAPPSCSSGDIALCISQAEAGNINAQNALGLRYSNGDGVLQDYVEAAKWFRRAAEAGFAIAQCNLGWAYFEGIGVPQDIRFAYMWLNLSAAQGGTLCSGSGRDHVARYMTPAQITEAQKMSRQCLARNYKGC